MAKRVAIYLRVSTDQQTTEHQRPEVEQLARARGNIVATYEERASASKQRPEFDRMMRDARRGKLDTLVVWALDRFGRSMVGNLQDVLELDRLGVQIVSVRESWLDTAGPTRSLLVGIFSWVAEQERVRLIERTKAGMATARRRGKRIGRPRRRFDLDEVRRLVRQGASLRQAATTVGVPFSTVQRAWASDPKGCPELVDGSA
jgi:putative DNA-invertase from lambdoid prophage Rac